jgi:hypothetical protein
MRSDKFANGAKSFQQKRSESSFENKHTKKEAQGQFMGRTISAVVFFRVLKMQSEDALIRNLIFSCDHPQCLALPE